jgi:hypothetical protein
MKEQTKSKVKNPLYVVKGKDVQEAKHLLDLVLKKFNLEPVVEFIQNMLKMILENIKSYPTFVAMKNLLDELMLKIFGLVSKLGFA